jgi:multidrug efflux pump subunit AcrB
MAGASSADMARTVATPLERTLGTIAGVNEMTSSSSTGSSRVVLQLTWPQHRQRRARRAGRHQRRPHRHAGQPAHQPHLPQGQPRRRSPS